VIAGPVLSVLGEVFAERERQNAKWGEQNHPDGTGPDKAWPLSPLPTSVARDAIRSTVDHLARAGDSEWWAILLEEVAEALAEDDPARLRAELVQVAAVAVSWAEAIDRRAVSDA